MKINPNATSPSHFYNPPAVVSRVCSWEIFWKCPSIFEMSAEEFVQMNRRSYMTVTIDLIYTFIYFIEYERRRESNFWNTNLFHLFIYLKALCFKCWVVVVMFCLIHFLNLQIFILSLSLFWCFINDIWISSQILDSYSWHVLKSTFRAIPFFKLF